MTLSSGRYIAYGLVWIGLTGNIIYIALLARAVQLGGIAIASIVIDLLPIVVTVVASRDTSAVSSGVDAGILNLPLVKQHRTHVMLTTGFRCWRAGFSLLHNLDNLGFRKK
ncbi:hypothetical protein KDM87_01635 [Undibacterium sp. FT147W]|uniref:Uncharacterized protein n=1 Tax=Undibacterium rivi TaxID=2828729 RepID=A0ABS5GY28_9BURK|nr:hypothetical protein [Undibacterium rivi]MBR7791283.1 hypothetical protein [Undibacterium rivi]